MINRAIKKLFLTPSARQRYSTKNHMVILVTYLKGELNEYVCYIICCHSKGLKRFHFEPTVQNYGPLWTRKDFLTSKKHKKSTIVKIRYKFAITPVLVPQIQN